MAQMKNTVRGDMNDAEVQVALNAAFATYEKETAMPRHKENLANFDELFGALNRFKGAMIVMCACVGIPGMVASLLVILHAVRGR